MEDRIDLYIGLLSYAPFLTKAGITHLKSLTLTLVSEPPANSCVNQPPR